APSGKGQTAGIEKMFGLARFSIPASVGTFGTFPAVIGVSTGLTSRAALPFQSPRRGCRGAIPMTYRRPSLIAIVVCALLPLAVMAQAGRPPEGAKPPELVRQRLTEPLLAVDVSPDGRGIVCSGQNRAVQQIGLDGVDYPA